MTILELQKIKTIIANIKSKSGQEEINKEEALQIIEREITLKLLDPRKG